MPRNMSFALTVEQVRTKTKTVTRRQGWDRLVVGDVVQPVVKCMGLKKGEKVEKIGGLIKILSIYSEHIKYITMLDCIAEGFPGLTPDDFVEMYCRANRCEPVDRCNRIEFEYL